MTKFGIFLCLVLTISCSTVRLSSETLIPVVFESKEDHTRDISIEVTRDFYLWGLYPDTHEIKVDKAFANKGFDSVAEMKIEDHSNKYDMAWALLTFGFYMPKSYVLKGKTYIR
ncbi:MAG: hypothetical protein WEB87_03545 [Bacteriovoracaceae bacterium]